MHSKIYSSIKQCNNTLNTDTLEFDFTKVKNIVIRRFLIQKRSQKPKCIETWEEKLGVDITKFFFIGNKATKGISLRFLHFRIMHHIFPTNKILAKMNVKPSDKCDKCQHVETLEHLFFHCKELSQFWQHVSADISDILGWKTQIDVVTALFGFDPNEMNARNSIVNQINHLLLIAKSCISKNKSSQENGNLILQYEYNKILRGKYLQNRKP